MKTFNLILSALTILFLLLTPIVFSGVTELILEFGEDLSCEGTCPCTNPGCVMSCGDKFDFQKASDRDYYNFTIQEPMDVSVKIYPDAVSDYNLYINWTEEVCPVKRLSTTGFCGPQLPGDATELCSNPTLPVGTYYFMVSNYSTILSPTTGTYNVSLECNSISSTLVVLGSGVNISAGTIIRLPGLNCNLTLADNHIVDKLEVHSDYLLMNVSSAPTWIQDLPYTYSQAQQAIYIKCYQNTERTLYVHTSDLGDGIKVYSISDPAHLMSVSWSEANQEFRLTVNSSLSSSMTEVYWPYASEPSHSCDHEPCGFSWDSVNRIATLTSTHNSPVEWTLGVQAESEPPKWSNLDHYPEPPAVITTLDDVTINVTWSDDVGLEAVTIWENSTGEWQGHVV